MDLKIYKNFLSMATLQVANYIAPIVTLPHLTRTLGAENFGALNYCFAISGLLAVITDWGFNLSATRKIANSTRTPKEISEVFWGTFYAKLSISLLTFLFLFLATIAIESLENLSSIIFITWLMVAGNAINLNWYLQGKNKFGGIALAGITAKLLTIPAILTLVNTKDDTWIAAAINSSSFILAGLASIIYCSRFEKVLWVAPSVRKIKNQIVDGWDVFISSLSVSLFTSINTVILGATSGMNQVATYNAAEKIKSALNMPPTQLTSVIYPRVSAAYKTDTNQAKKLTSANIIFNAATTVSMLFFLLFFSEKIILAIFPDEFKESAHILIILYSSYVFGNIAYPIGLLVLLNSGMSKARTKVMFIAGISSIPTTYLLSINYGAKGAAYSVVVSEFLILIGFLLILRHHIKTKKTLL